MFNVAHESMYKYRVFAGGVNVAKPRLKGVEIPTSPYDESDQDYFVASAQEWVYGTRFADDPRSAAIPSPSRQFRVCRCAKWPL